MKCIYCGNEKTGVSNSGTSIKGNTCRRLTCKACGQKFYTIERAATQVELDECRDALWVRTKNRVND